jgi:hypothetical protein
VARGKDGVFAQVSCRILHGQRFNRLSEADQGFYLKLWILAVRERTTCFPVTNYPTIYLSRELHVEHRRGKRALANLASQRLIHIAIDGTITIEGIKECHKRFGLEKVHETDDSCTKPGTSNRTDHRDQSIDPESGMSSCIYTDPDSENVTQKEQPSPPGPAGAVDVKNLLRKAEEESDRRHGGNGDGDVTDEPWNQVSQETELELEVHRWFLELWPDGDYDWETEKDSLLSQVRIYKRGAYNVARIALLEKRKRGEWIENELAWMNDRAKRDSATRKGGNPE